MLDDADAVLTPSQLNTLARNLLEDTFPLVTVEGELGNVARPSSGHVYFTLKDARAQVRCALFRPKSQWLKFQPRDGLHVQARGRVTLYEARGEYQMVVDSLEEAGEGALRRALEALRLKLQAEGLFDAGRKRPLPRFVRRLGVLTSPSGAAVRDVLSVLGRRFPLLEVDVLPVPVQGADAAQRIATMLARASASGRYDVLLVTRGGGSLEDLWAFNEEPLVRAIAASTVPVVSAVGHESDTTLGDFAADLRAATPSAAAELLTPHRTDLQVRLGTALRHLDARRLQRMQETAQRLDRARLRLEARSPTARLESLESRRRQLLHRMEAAWRRRHAEDAARLRHAATVLRARHPAGTLSRLRERLAAIGMRPRIAIANTLRNDTLRLRGIAQSMHAISPMATVARGYAILTTDAARPVTSVAGLVRDQRIHARLADGVLDLRLEAINPLPTPEA